MKKEIKLYRNLKKTRNLLLHAGFINLLFSLIFLHCIGAFGGDLKIKLAVISGVFLLIILSLTFKSLIGTLDKSPLIQIDAVGFFGKTTPLSKSFGRVEWADVKNLELGKDGGDTLVIATIGNTEKYRNRLSALKWKMVYGKKKSEITLMYSASEIEINAKELYDLFVSYWKGYEVTCQQFPASKLVLDE